MKVGYARVSTDGQSPDSQIALLKEAGCEAIFCDHGWSGSIKSRPELLKCFSVLRKGDTLYVYKLDRLGRSALHCMEMLAMFGESGINFVSLSEGIDTNSPYGRAIFGIMSTIAQLEREVIRERVRDGVRHARKKKKTWGRQKKDIKIDPFDPRPVTQLAKDFGVTRNTIYRALRDRDKEHREKVKEAMKDANGVSITRGKDRAADGQVD